MTDAMTKWGVGPRFTRYFIIYGVLMYALTWYLDPIFTITFVQYRTLAAAGTVLVCLGIPFYLSSIVSVMRAFRAGELVTGGVYGMCRHPVYAAWLVFFVPGIALLLKSWLLLSAPVVMYFVAKGLVREEDAYLEKTFGQAYLAYKDRVPSMLPYGWFRNKGSGLREDA